MHCTLLAMSGCYGVMAVKMSVLKVLPLEAQRGKRRARSMRQNARRKSSRWKTWLKSYKSCMETNWNRMTPNIVCGLE